jgi:hypothetical protein
LNNNNGYDKIKVANGIQQRSYVSFFWSGVCVLSSLDCRANVEQFNHQCFERSAKICELLDTEVKKPRICWRQIMRDNVEAESPEDYFRKSITVPFYYCMLNEMKTRFTVLLW